MLMIVQTPQQGIVVLPSQAIKPSILILLLAPQMKKEFISIMDDKIYDINRLMSLWGDFKTRQNKDLTKYKLVCNQEFLMLKTLSTTKKGL